MKVAQWICDCIKWYKAEITNPSKRGSVEGAFWSCRTLLASFAELLCKLRFILHDEKTFDCWLSEAHNFTDNVRQLNLKTSSGLREKVTNLGNERDWDCPPLLLGQIEYIFRRGETFLNDEKNRLILERKRLILLHWKLNFKN